MSLPAAGIYGSLKRAIAPDAAPQSPAKHPSVAARAAATQRRPAEHPAHGTATLAILVGRVVGRDIEGIDVGHGGGVTLQAYGR
jgi:hypothetical protein